jgi:hypothetical protein
MTPYGIVAMPQYCVAPSPPTAPEVSAGARQEVFEAPFAIYQIERELEA